jgi:hypothetical protein
MALNRTNLVLKGAPLPVDFRGTVQELFEEMIRRLSILSPVGTNFFVVGTVEPSSNVGPWLRNGTQWWVFDETEGRYVPGDITESLPPLFFIQDTNPGTPGPDQPLVWIRTNQDRIVGIYGWDGTAWQASANITHSGTTAQRPTLPVDLEEFYDTDINVLLRYERGAWRTAAGSPGDVKAVTHVTLVEAKRFNPGWELLGKDDESQRGRFIGMASKDPGAAPVSAFTTSSGITSKAAGEQAGAETVVLNSEQIEQHSHEIGHIFANAADQRFRIHRVNDADTLVIPAPEPPNHFRSDGPAGFDLGTIGDAVAGTAGDGPTGAKLITAKQYSKVDAAGLTTAAQAHENQPQSLWLWNLYKL